MMLGEKKCEKKEQKGTKQENNHYDIFALFHQTFYIGSQDLFCWMNFGVIWCILNPSTLVWIGTMD